MPLSPLTAACSRLDAAVVRLEAGFSHLETAVSQKFDRDEADIAGLRADLAKAEAALADEREAIRRVAREHWLRVARETVNAMEYDLQSIRRGHGTVGFYTKGVPQRELRRPSARARIDAAIATDEHAKREFPGLIAKTTASIQEAEREIAAENAIGFHVFGEAAPRG